MRRRTGNFTATMGNTTWNLTAVCFDSPNPDGAEHFDYHQHPMTATQYRPDRAGRARPDRSALPCE